jgi:hypothetical protein
MDTPISLLTISSTRGTPQRKYPFPAIPALVGEIAAFFRKVAAECVSWTNIQMPCFSAFFSDKLDCEIITLFG